MCAQSREPVLDAACGNTDGGAHNDREAEGTTLFGLSRNLAAALWIDRALHHALPWPLCACFWSPMDGFGTDQHVLVALCMLLCAMLRGSRVMRIATLKQMLLVLLRKKSRVSRVQTSGAVSSLNMLLGVLETL